MTKLNILESEIPFLIEAKTYDYSMKKSISYHFIDSSYSICLDKSELILAKPLDFNRLLKYTKNESDSDATIRELEELKLTLDMMHY